jgi:hypothetical protein
LYNNDLAEISPANISGNYLYGTIAQRRVGIICELKFGGFKNLIQGQEITVGTVDSRLKPAFINVWKVSGGDNTYQITVDVNGSIKVFAYGSTNDQNNVNPTIVYFAK